MRKRVVLVGAGISVASPSNLPSWWSFNEALVSGIKEKALELCPEANYLISSIDIKNSFPVQCVSDIIVNQGAGESYFPLLTLLNSTRPNINHYALAELADKNLISAIITTNFDTLIESAFSKRSVPLFVASKEEDYLMLPTNGFCRLLKIHGSVVDHRTLIDTVTQKSVGLSPNKLLALKGFLLDSEIIVIGFSGADLDFDINYIPFSDAIASGSTVKWIVRPGTRPNRNVLKLKEMYPSSLEIIFDSIPEYYEKLGLDIMSIHDPMKDYKPAEAGYKLMDKEIKKALSLQHIGTHGCVGYCISLLKASGKSSEASKLADIYENHLKRSDINPLSAVLGMIALGLERIDEKNYIKAKYWFGKCISVFKLLLKSADSIVDSQIKNNSQKETLSNLASCYTNLGTVFLYEKKPDKALLFFKKAKHSAEQAESKKHIGIALFNIARAQYAVERDYDRLLIGLRTAANYSKQAGNIKTFIEIIICDCIKRLLLGEYYIVKKNLEQIEANINNTVENDYWIWLFLIRSVLKLRMGSYKESIKNMEKAVSYAEKDTSGKMAETLLSYVLSMFFYHKRSCKLIVRLCKSAGKNSVAILNDFCRIDLSYKKMTNKLPLIILNTLPDDKYRKIIILLEYQKRRELVSSLFEIISGEYLKKRGWLRLTELSECCYDASVSKAQKSVALYRKGCALLETGEYIEALDRFDQIIELGKDADQIILGWSYIEAAGLLSNSPRNFHKMNQYYSKGIELLYLLSVSNMEAACMTFIDKLLSLKQYGEAIKKLEVLSRMDISDDFKGYVTERLEEIRSNMNGEQIVETVITKESAEYIANEALQSYATDPKRAWELIRISKEKYAAKGNRIGIAKCENNMGVFCIEENNYSEAVEHFTESYKIKSMENCMDGAVSDLATIINISCCSDEDINITDQINFTELHLPDYKTCPSRYKLYYSLCIYYLKAGKLGTAYQYADSAYVGIDFTNINDSIIKASLERLFNYVDGFFNNTETDKTSGFDKKIKKLIQAYRIGEIEEFNSSIRQLRESVGINKLKSGQIEGTMANANLELKKYEEAIKCYDDALDCFYEAQKVGNISAEAFILTAVNGKAIALSRLNKNKESLDLLSGFLSGKELDTPSMALLAINYCNRVITSTEEITKGSKIYQELKAYLDEIGKKCSLPHEENGAYHHTYGILCFAVSEYSEAERHFKTAKHKFELINSQYAQNSALMLERIKERAFF